MSTVLESGFLPAPRGRWRPWVLAALGLAALFVPTWADFARGVWREDAYAHGPIILALVAWMFWKARAVLVEGDSRPAPLAGALLLGVGLVLWLAGRTFGLAPFEAAAHVPVVAGVVLLLRGWDALRRLAFPILFLAFLVPLPGFVLDAATAPLKVMVSSLVGSMLSMLGYDVARSGVVLAVEGHELLVADACSGLNSITSLFALALFYLHATGPSSRARILLVLAAVVPVAIVGNVLRVLALVLLTVHAGDEAAQGLVHEFAGLAVFALALGLLLAVDGFIARRFPVRRHVVLDRPATADPAFGRRPPMILLGALAAVAMALTSAAAPLVKPRASAAGVDLERLVPSRFGDWSLEAGTDSVPPAPDVEANLSRLYNQVLERTYVNGSGEQIMLTIAYGGDQGDSLKAHRQEACYAAQGFEIHGLESARLTAAGRDVPVTRMLAVRGERSEPVTYWFTMGDRVVLGRLERLRVQLAYGLSGRVPDGLLVRVSSLSARPSEAYALQAAFVAALLQPLPPSEATRLAGRPESEPRT